MQINLSLSTSVIMGLLLIIVGLIQMYKGATYQVPTLSRENESFDLTKLTTDQSSEENGVVMVTQRDKLQMVSGILFVVYGILKAYGKDSA